MTPAGAYSMLDDGPLPIVFAGGFAEICNIVEVYFLFLLSCKFAGTLQNQNLLLKQWLLSELPF
jgi:hypothetical protein